VLAQAAGLALLGALSPTALLVAAVYLGSASPRRTAACYLAGAVAVSTVMAVVALVVLRGAGLSHPAEGPARYGLRLGLGLLLAAAALVVEARRRRRRPAQLQEGRGGQTERGIVSRLAASPSPATAFTAGVLVFAPGVTFLAAVQVIATARASIGLTIAGTVVVIIIDLLLAWLPLLLYLAAPGLTERRLKAFNGWLRAHGSALLAAVLAVAAVILIFDGCYGLTT
jgi:Sap, sulfolipid-1-addressing protein